MACPMMSLVEDTFIESRSISDASRTVGKAEKSSGRSMNNVTVNIRIANAKEVASPTSKTHAGMGRTIITITAIRAKASRIVGLNISDREKFMVDYPFPFVKNGVAGWLPIGTKDPIPV